MAEYEASANRMPVLSSDEERTLAVAAQAGDQHAYKSLVESNLRLVLAIAKTKAADPDELTRLVGAGNLGLVRAIHKFAPDHEYRFATYATWWIRQAISKQKADDDRSPPA